MKPLLALLAAAALVAVLVIGLTQAGDDGDGSAGAPVSVYDAAKAERELAGAPEPLAGLYRERSRLLPGGRKAFEARLRKLRGRPIVVNAWAAWCGPCRIEFPAFQELSVARGKEIAFLGINANDNSDDARAFLADFPVPYPSYEDPRFNITRSLGAAVGLPQTVFIDRKGEVAYIHPGQYRRPGDLAADIERYLKA